MDERDILRNPTLPVGSAVWDSNGTIHWAVGERAVPNARGTLMAWAACATPQPALPPHNPGYLDAPLDQVVMVRGQTGAPKPKPNCPKCLALYSIPVVQDGM